MIKSGQPPSVVNRRDPEIHEIDELMAQVELKLSEDDEREAATEYGFLSDVLLQDKLDQMTQAKAGWSWDTYQRIYFDTQQNYVCNKCRQSGGSTMGAGKKTARGILYTTEYTAVMTSYKKEEAIGKIDYVRKFLGAMPPRFSKKEIRSPRQLIEWENANLSRAKIMSHAQKPIRGVSGEVFLTN